MCTSSDSYQPQALLPIDNGQSVTDNPPLVVLKRGVKTAMKRVRDSTDGYLPLDDQALVGQCSVDHYRSSGPGGQKRNKTSSAVRLRHHPTGLSVTAADDRSQRVNTVRAIRRLREAIALHVRAELGLERYQPSELMLSCVTSDGRIAVGQRDGRYFSAVREILDVLAACGMRISDAAEKIGVSTAHLVKFVQSDPKLWERVNQMRAGAGVKPLR